MNLKRPLQEIEYEFFSDQERCMNTICRHVSNGGSVTDLAKTLGIRYCDIMKFIRECQNRTKRYELALFDRNEWIKETVLKELRVIALEHSEVDQETGLSKMASTRDRLKSIELIGKNLQIFTDNLKLSGTVTLEDIVSKSHE